MAKADALLRTVETIYAAGLDATRWPQALAVATELIGGNGATFETFDKASSRPVEWHDWGIPDASEIAYLADYAPLSPRPALGFRLGGGAILYDYLVLDEAALARDPFYQDFLARYGFGYFIAVNVLQSREFVSPFAIQRSPKQGHVGRREIDLMRRLAPHLQQAHDMARRLKRSRSAADDLERAFDWLGDGVMLVTVDGNVTYANVAMQEIFRRADGFRLFKGRLEIADTTARARYAAALGSVARLRSGEPDAIGGDFTAQRPSRAPPYLISMRPLASSATEDQRPATAIVFVQDPLRQKASAAPTLRDVFGLTQAEAALAVALQGGDSVGEYASAKGLSRNTVYTHLRRLKEKTGVKRQLDLIRKLHDVKLPLRRD
jgi:DNA-binding CsgD family transcriptional regulator/PAS domain-containing protein